LVFLEEKGLAYREFRNINVNGHILNNVMYLGINAEKIQQITRKRPSLNSSYSPSSVSQASSETLDKEPNQDVQDAQTQGNRCLQKRKQGVTKKEIAPYKKGTTNTKTSTKISKVNDKDWSLTFSKDEKEFLSYLLKIQPEKGNPIEKDTAT
jgi:hypothetical protein